ncbi:hypothetical protein [Streptomyces virginiae]|uniref:hypothetical protein n=1 Tax=Streptomyces virginiae TaxID=1961 RepID=UPI0036396B54
MLGVWCRRSVGSCYAENKRDFPELAEEIGRRAVGMTQAEADAGHRERTAQMIRPAELMAAGHSVAASPVQAEIDAQYAWTTTPGAPPTRPPPAPRPQSQRRRTSDQLTRHGVHVVDATPDTLAPALADAYLALKAAGRL